MPKPPRSMMIVGAGSVGVEFGYLYHSFGTKIQLVEMMPHILPTVDEEISRALQKSFEKAGMRIFTDMRLAHLKVEKNGVTARLSDNKGTRESIRAECCLTAIGVQGNVEGLGLEELGVKIENNFIVTDAFMQTNIEGIYAVGDVAGEPCLAHVASHEAIVCVDRIAGRKTPAMDYDSFPSCTYCRPQVAGVGLTEAQALNQGYETKVGRFPFSASGKARVIGETEGFIKVVFDVQYKELLGAHIIGPEATELISEFGLAKALECSDEEIIHNIHAHPTLSEAAWEATMDAFQGAIHF